MVRRDRARAARSRPQFVIPSRLIVTRLWAAAGGGPSRWHCLGLGIPGFSRQWQSSALLERILESLYATGFAPGDWTDNLAQVLRSAADSARFRPDDHGLVPSTYTTLASTEGELSGQPI